MRKVLQCGHKDVWPLQQCAYFAYLWSMTSSLIFMPDLSSLDSNGNSAAHTSQQQQDAVWLMKTTHANTFQARSSKTTTAKPPTPRTVPPGPRAGLTDTARMNTTASARPDRFITVCIEARIRKELYHSLGRIQRAYPADKDMDGQPLHLS